MPWFLGHKEHSCAHLATKEILQQMLYRVAECLPGYRRLLLGYIYTEETVTECGMEKWFLGSFEDVCVFQEILNHSGWF